MSYLNNSEDDVFGNSNLRPPGKHKEGLAIISLIFGILSVTIGWLLCCMPGIFGFPAIVTGHVSLSQNKAQPMVYGGVGMAKAGLVMGYLSVLFTLGLLAVGALIPDSDISTARSDSFEKWIGETAPDFSITTIDGTEVTLNSLRGRMVIVDFWATWCGPCKKEIPHFIRLANEYESKELTIIGISDEPESRIRQFAQKHGINYLVASDKLNFAPYDSITGIPTTFFIDGDGIVQDVHVGYMDYKEIRDSIFP